ncbi:hypothetical protein PCANC_21460 [Puccinia coronata f. sp. avenae]|uniref:DUF6589 domain-containing protein n=1 Tax=Puccinia coronata f. sp. avenae TaxID=200324 RepID=A0A2N5SE94_9BASI|nr:hypothetical protein PCANC_21460 [Puccinia coronata f. sp. avenae]
MLRLMLESDNSAAGVGEVFTGIIQQSGLTSEEFHSRLQVIEGDLGSCNLFDSLRNQRTPARYRHTSLDNVLPIPGAAHTLWNLGQTVYLEHWGDKKHAWDTGAWQSLHALGIPVNKPVTKKDFNLMLSHIERIHTATIIYCALTVLKKAHEPLGPILAKKTSQEILDLVNEIYSKFCSGASRQTKISQKSISHNNMLLRIRDFATIIEAKNAMKAGDPGRLMYMWKRWAVMGQGMPKLPHYSKHLPRLILMLEEGLPPSMDKVVMSTMLISPTGKADQLKDVFSLNIPTL